MKYNATYPPIRLREFGRNIQAAVEHIMKQPDKAQRTQMAMRLVRIIYQLNPQIKENPETREYIWNCLYVMSDYNLDVDFPVPVLDKSQRLSPPQRVPYMRLKPAYAQYGNNVQLSLNIAADLPDSRHKWETIFKVAGFMRQCLQELDKEANMEIVLSKHIQEITDGKIYISPEDLVFEDAPLTDQQISRGNNAFTSKSVKTPLKKDNKKRNRGGKRKIR